QPDLNRAMAQPSMLVAGRQGWHASRLRPLSWVPRGLSCAPLCATVWPPLASNPSPKRRDAMSVGIVVPLPAYTLDPAFMAKKAGACASESLWHPKHPISPADAAPPSPAPGAPTPWTSRHFSEPYIALAMAAAVTSTIKLATGITLVTERNPLLLAKEIAVLDLHSNGRFLFGVGAGWNREETTIMGGDFDHRWTQAR